MKQFALIMMLCLALQYVNGVTRSVGNPDRNLIQVTVGSGDELAPIPVHLFYRTSLFERIFLSEEINAAGSITQLVFYNSFANDILDTPTMIWLGECLENDLTGGWIPSSRLYPVFDGLVDYPIGQNTITINLQNPYPYQGGNLVLLVFKPWQDVYTVNNNNFLADTVGDNRSLFSYNHNTNINPNGPPPTGVTGQFPKTTFVIDTAGTGSLSGYVRQGATPLEGALVSIADSPVYRFTDETGAYSFPYLQAGNYIVQAEKTGYQTLMQAIGLSSGQSLSLDFNLDALPQYFVMGRVVGSDNPALGIAGAEVRINGYANFECTTDDAGSFFLPAIYANRSYTYTISSPGYQTLNGAFNLGNTDLDLGDLILSEVAYAPQNLTAMEGGGGSQVDLSWEAPMEPDSGWLHYDNGDNYSSFGTGGSLSFDVASRFPADSLAAYAGSYLQAVRYWPATGGNFVVKVWRGGSVEGPGALIVSQPVVPVLNAWNTLQLDFPVLITGTEEIWVGFLCDVTGVNLAYAGFDAGPAVNGFGNLIHWQGNWTTLLAVNSYCDFNWNLQAYVGITAPDGSDHLVALGSDRREMLGYQVWRFLQGQETNESAWTSLSPTVLTELSFVDNGWESLPSGNYVWAVKTVYSGDVLSEAAFSNPLTKVSQMGSIAGVVRSQSNQAIAGATVSAGSNNTTTNAAGMYVLALPAGTYSVTASAPGYLPETMTGVIVQSGEGTPLNFMLVSDSYLIYADGFESYPDFALSFSPWILDDVDLSHTYGITGTTWTNIYEPMAFMIFNPSATVPPLIDFEPYEGDKFAVSIASTTPPNNDWIISPLVEAGFISFWARSYVADYGLERFKVGISTGSVIPQAFQIISGPNYLEAPVMWTQYTYHLPSEYYYQNIRVGIQCLSDDAFIFALDDFHAAGITANEEDTNSSALLTRLQSIYPNPFNPETTIRYSLKEAGMVSFGIYNLRGQLVRTLMVAQKPAGNHSIVWNGLDNSGRAVSSGIYYCRMSSGDFTSSLKMILMK